MEAGGGEEVEDLAQVDVLPSFPESPFSLLLDC